MEIRQLNGEERFQAGLIMTVAFHGRMEDPEKEREECLKSVSQQWGAFDDDGTLMAQIVNHRFMSFLDGRQIPNGGIGGVSTLPEYRSSGAIRRIFASLLAQDYKDGRVISTLYPFNHAFYRRFGYETIAWKNVYEFPPSVLKEYRFTGKVRLWKTGDPVTEWTALYNRFASEYNLALLRRDEDMLRHMKGEYYRDRKFCYMLCEAEEPVAFLIFEDVTEKDRPVLNIRNIAWLERRGLLALMGFLARFDADYATIRLFLPRDIELMNLIHSPQAYDMTKQTHQDYMLRVVHADKLLETIKKPADCRFKVAVRDDMIPENDRVFEVSARGVTVTDAKPDLSVSVCALGQLCCGAVSLREAMYREDVSLYGNMDMLESVFVCKPILVEDAF